MGHISISSNALYKRFHTVTFDVTRKVFVKFQLVTIHKNGKNLRLKFHKISEFTQKSTVYIEKKRHQADQMIFFDTLN